MSIFLGQSSVRRSASQPPLTQAQRAKIYRQKLKLDDQKYRQQMDKHNLRNRQRYAVQKREQDRSGLQGPMISAVCILAKILHNLRKIILNSN